MVNYSPFFDPHNVDLDEASERDVTCYLNLGSNKYSGALGARISAVFVILILSTAATAFPVLGRRFKGTIMTYVYLFARYFGTGVIIATAFVHLLDPAWKRIGGNTCVGMTGNWDIYNWTPAIILASAMMVFLVDVIGNTYIERKYGVVAVHDHGASLIDDSNPNNDPSAIKPATTKTMSDEMESNSSTNEQAVEVAFAQQFTAFLILEAGIIWHSVFIGLNFGVTNEEWKVLYPVLVFHQAFEGLGIGARMSAIPFPKRLKWTRWVLCVAYGLTTPIAMAVGLGLRTQLNPKSFNYTLIKGVIDAISGGILLYNGFVELLARDFIFERSNNSQNLTRLTFNLVCVFLGAGVMSLIGWWA
ncbi:hypothetical protein MBLNU230_g0641t1 [Neophaeotheca triangularis]